MFSFIAGFFLLIWVAGSILVNGIAGLHYATKLRCLALIGYGAAAGATMHGLLGWAIAAFPAGRWIFVGLLFALTFGSAFYWAAQGVLGELLTTLARPIKISLALWLGLLVVSLGVVHLHVRFPNSLPDGYYISKQHTTNVKIQCLTGLTADNYIPFAVAEIFLRGLSFNKVRPVLPGNEVSDRTILMSLVSMPFQAVLEAPRDYPVLGTYPYIDRPWPNVWALNTHDQFGEFLVIGLFLNSLLLLGLLVFCSSLGATSILPFATLLYLTNPYFISQTIFTWPKSLAGFFILLAWTSLRKGHAPAIVAILMALAYHSHPYAIVFAGWIGIFYLREWRRERNSRLPAALLYLVVLGLCLSPWFIWTKWVLKIPSDLMAQNFAGQGTAAAWAAPINFVWIRFQNLFLMMSPMMLWVYPFNLSPVVNYWMTCVPGIVGLVTIFPALAQCAELPKPQPWLWYGLLGPAGSILLVFSCPALPVLHGYQPLLGVLLFFGVWWLVEHTRRSVAMALLLLQLAINLWVCYGRGSLSGVHLW